MAMFTVEHSYKMSVKLLSKYLKHTHKHTKDFLLWNQRQK